MNKHILFSLAAALVAIMASIAFVSCENRDKDLTPPVISQADFLPANCDIYYLGEIIQVRFTCTDNTELGNFNIEIHNNFDHHTHSTEAEDCDEGEEHHEDEEHHDEEEHEHHHDEVEGAWVFNQDYAIPAGQKEYTAAIDIPVPEDVRDGDYHFMLRLTDRAGWQTIKAVAIKIIRNQ